MSLRPGAVDFDDKWRDLRQTIDSVVHLRSVKRVRWNDNISYPLTTRDPNKRIGHQKQFNRERVCAWLPNCFVAKLYIVMLVSGEDSYEFFDSELPIR